MKNEVINSKLIKYYKNSIAKIRKYKDSIKLFLKS